MWNFEICGVVVVVVVVVTNENDCRHLKKKKSHSDEKRICRNHQSLLYNDCWRVLKEENDRWSVVVVLLPCLREISSPAGFELSR